MRKNFLMVEISGMGASHSEFNMLEFKDGKLFDIAHIPTRNTKMIKDVILNKLKSSDVKTIVMDCASSGVHVFDTLTEFIGDDVEIIALKCSTIYDTVVKGIKKIEDGSIDTDFEKLKDVNNANPLVSIFKRQLTRELNNLFIKVDDSEYEDRVKVCRKNDEIGDELGRTYIIGLAYMEGEDIINKTDEYHNRRWGIKPEDTGIDQDGESEEEVAMKGIRIGNTMIIVQTSLYNKVEPMTSRMVESFRKDGYETMVLLVKDIEEINRIDDKLDAYASENTKDREKRDVELKIYDNIRQTQLRQIRELLYCGFLSLK